MQQQHHPKGTNVSRSILEFRELSALRMKFRVLTEDYEKLQNDFSQLQRKLEETEKELDLYRSKSKYYEDILSRMERKEAITKYMTKETYSFLRSEGYVFNYHKNRWQRTESETKK